MATADITKPWNENDLTRFFDMVDQNCRTNQQRFTELYGLIVRTDANFTYARNKYISAEPIILSTLLVRCHCAWRTAAKLALAGQASECFALLRTALEYAGYAFRIFDTPDLQSVFLNRHKTIEGKDDVRRDFSIKKVREAIARHDLKLAADFDHFYEYTINYGAHPNANGILQTVCLKEQDGVLISSDLVTRKETLEHALTITTEVGLNALYILQHIFKIRFEILDVHNKSQVSHT